MSERASTGSQPRRRASRQRAAIAAALERAEGFMSAQEIFDRVRARGAKVGLTTIYRTLQLLADAGEVDILHSAEGEALYRRCPTDVHHHHLVCRSCRRSVEIESSDVERWATQVARRYGFSSSTHLVEIFGLCSDCA